LKKLNNANHNNTSKNSFNSPRPTFILNGFLDLTQNFQLIGSKVLNEFIKSHVFEALGIE